MDIGFWSKIHEIFSVTVEQKNSENPLKVLIEKERESCLDLTDSSFDETRAVLQFLDEQIEVLKCKKQALLLELDQELGNKEVLAGIRAQKQQSIHDMISRLESQVLKLVYGELTQIRTKFLENRKRRLTLPEEAQRILQNWFNQNKDNPYPSKEQKQQLANEANLSLSQVSVWFSNKRYRCK